MSELRDKCLELLAQIPDEDLQQVIDEIEGIIQYHKEAAEYIPHPQSQIEEFTIQLVPIPRKKKVRTYMEGG